MRTNSNTISVCSVIPPHILRHAAERGDENARQTLQSTLQYSSLIAGRRRHGLFLVPRSSGAPRKRRNVYSARGGRDLPGRLVMSESHRHATADVEAIEAFDGSGATYDFYAEVFKRNSIDDRGMALDSTIHYGFQFDNALWNGQQMIYGDGDGKLFNRFTSCIEVIAHELTHGVTQHTARLLYEGQSGALSEHLSDAFGIMVKQYHLGLSANESDWLIGAELLTKGVQGKAIRSMAAPGTAYDDPILGKDLQAASMKDYVDSPEDNGGVHVNSGIPNRAFYLAAVAIGGNAWEVAGRIWYDTLTSRLKPTAQFHDFAEATVAAAGELYGSGGKVQNIVAQAWSEVGLPLRAAKSALPAMIAVKGAAVTGPRCEGANPDGPSPWPDTTTDVAVDRVGLGCTEPNLDVATEPFKAGKDLLQAEPPAGERDPFKAGKDLARARKRFKAGKDLARARRRKAKRARRLRQFWQSQSGSVNQGRRRRWFDTATCHEVPPGGWRDCLATIAACLDHLEQHFRTTPTPAVILSRRRPEGAKHGEGSPAGNCGISTTPTATDNERNDIMTASIHTGSTISYDHIDAAMEEAFTLALSLGVGVAYHPNASLEPAVTAGVQIEEFWDQGQRLANLESLYKAVRPILSVVATLQLIPQQWRIVIGAFLAALDALIANQQQKAA